jgi:DNA polymerase III delta subunit
MIYLLLGEDSSAKRKKIDDIKSSILPSDDAVKFDYELLHGAKLDPVVLKKALLALPAVAKARLILIRTIEKLNAQNKDIILDFIRGDNPHAALVLDSVETSFKGEFFRDCLSAAEVLRFGQKGKKNDIWGVTKAIESRNSGEALRVLNTLLEDGDSPLRIMGGLVWFWGSLRNRVSANSFKKGLLVLQEADLNIKRSRLKPEYAVEIAVTKLSSLAAC